MLHVTKYGEPYPTGLRVSNTVVTPGVLFVSQTGRNMCNVLQIIKFPIKVFCCNRVTCYRLLHSPLLSAGFVARVRYVALVPK